MYSGHRCALCHISAIKGMSTRSLVFLVYRTSLYFVCVVFISVFELALFLMIVLGRGLIRMNCLTLVRLLVPRSLVVARKLSIELTTGSITLLESEVTVAVGGTLGRGNQSGIGFRVGIGKSGVHSTISGTSESRVTGTNTGGELLLPLRLFTVLVLT